MGRKGLETRRRLIDAAVAQISGKRLRDLRVAEIARDAGSSPATFYVYFADISEVVLAALDELTQSAPELLAMANADWSEGDPLVRARRMVDHYASYWADHTALFQMRNLAADEGDVRFRISREKATSGFLDAIGKAIARAKAAKWVADELDPRATAGVLMSMLERFAAVGYYYNWSEAEQENRCKAAAHMLAQFMGPPGR